MKLAITIAALATLTACGTTDIATRGIPADQHRGAANPADDADSESGVITISATSSIGPDGVVDGPHYTVQRRSIGTAPKLGGPRPTTLVSVRLPGGQVRTMTGADLGKLRENLGR